MSLRRQQGFSLIELAVVVLIGGLMLAFTTPAINRYLNEARLRDAGSRIAGDMRLARQKAVTNSSRMWFWAGNGTTDYWIGEQSWTGGLADTSSSFAATVWKGPYTLPSTVRIVNANWNGLNYFWYRPNGRPETIGHPTTSGSMLLVNTVGVPDTVTLNVDLSGSVWK